MLAFQGERVSRSWKTVLDAAWDDGVRFQLNDGQRNEADQLAMIASKGIYDRARNPFGAARYSKTAPHVKAGHEHHALDVDTAGGGNRELAAWLRRQGVDVSFNVPTEPWHLDCVNEQSLIDAAERLRWRWYTASELRWIREYDELKRTGRGRDRRAVLRRVMTDQRKRVWRAAQESGWDRANRRARYASLKARTT